MKNYQIYQYWKDLGFTEQETHIICRGLLKDGSGGPSQITKDMLANASMIIDSKKLSVTNQRLIMLGSVETNNLLNETKNGKTLRVNVRDSAKLLDSTKTRDYDTVEDTKVNNKLIVELK